MANKTSLINNVQVLKGSLPCLPQTDRLLMTEGMEWLRGFVSTYVFFFFPVNKVSRPTYLYEQRKDGSFEIFKILFILCI
jgi:hypothetical protein